MRRTWFTSGDWNFICDVCGVKRKASQGQERWDGLMVCMPTIKAGCWETRHPQDLIRPIPDQQKLPWTRPEAADQFIGPFAGNGQCDIINSQAVAGIGVAGCMIAGHDMGLGPSSP